HCESGRSATGLGVEHDIAADRARQRRMQRRHCRARHRQSEDPGAGGSPLLPRAQAIGRGFGMKVPLHPDKKAERRAGRMQGGFSLLEAIIAMVVMATGLLALYAWLGSNTIALQRVQANAASLEDARSALA